MKKIFRSTALLVALQIMAIAACPYGPAQATTQPASLGQELFRFGTKGTGPSQMTNVEHIALDPQGFIYTGDWDLKRLQRFSPKGELESIFYLDPDSRIWSLAFDRGGFLYAAVDGRLLRYDPSTWTLLGEVEPPEGTSFHAVTPRPGGGVAALTEGAGHVLILDKDGTVVRTFHDLMKDVGRDSLNNPFLAIDGRGYFYIADNYSIAIYRFDPEGRFLNRFGSQGEEPGQINTYVNGLAIDSQGQLWVGDWAGTSVFAPDGRFLQRFEDMRGEDFAISDQDELYMADDDKIVKYAAGKRTPSGGGSRVESEPSGKAGGARLAKPVKPVGLVSVDPKGFAYIGDPETGSVLRFAPWGDLEGSFALQKPASPWTGLAVDRGGTIYVAAADRLFRYDAAGKLLGEVQHPDGAGFFHVAPRPDAGVLASWRNPQRDDLVLVGKDGAIETIQRNAVTGTVGEPAGDVLVAMDGQRNLYAAATRLHTVCLFKHGGEYVNRFGSEGDEPGQFSGPLTGLAADGQGRIYVNDARRVSVFSAQDGRFLEWLGLQGTGLAISDEDEVLTADGKKVTRLQAAKPEEE